LTGTDLAACNDSSKGNYMNIRNRWVLALALCAAATAAEAATIVTLGSGFNSPAGVAVDGRGNVFVADADNNAVKEILAPGYTTVNTLGSGFNSPRGVAVDSRGNVFVGDYGNNAVKEILAPGYTTVNTLGGGFSRPIGVAVDGNGNVFVADYDNNAVKEILAPGYTTVNTLGSGFALPQGVAVDGSGNVFVAFAYNISGSAVNQILAPGYTTVNSLSNGFNSGFNQYIGVAVDGSGNVFVGDSSNNSVKEILALGYTTVTTLSSAFLGPYGVAVDGSGNVFVADIGHNAVKEILAPISVSTSCMMTFVGNQPFSMVAKVTGTTPTGNVTFNNGETVLCNRVALSSASARCTVSTLAVTGSNAADRYSFTGNYSGDSNNPPSNSTALTVTVLNASEVIFRNDFELDPASCPTH
jgi:streptogramin lyase